MKSFKTFLTESHYKAKGLIDFSGIKNEEDLKEYAKRKGKSDYTYKNGQKCTGEKIEGSYELIPVLIRETKKGYYSLLYDEKNIFVIFNGKMFELSRKNYKNDPVYDEMVKFGKKEGIEKFYFHELKETLW